MELFSHPLIRFHTRLRGAPRNQFSMGSCLDSRSCSRDRAPCSADLFTMQLMRFSRTHNGADGFGFYLIPLAVYRFVSPGMLVASAIRPRW
jgi:hypothetical protein